ncbi:S-adenosyl-L-methionine-dependent methyltransferase [Rickenella mellea]|uniref:S-adenosyl-L-methionine-dependent methyltransferase n=1 Tax=Rickenella mellea TaxID=50990 RepID=A0A4Y7PMY1_9AGAM|nr:S-adenosyl-L-methionine-dependent methyltransferase [Rickenella mellea]
MSDYSFSGSSDGSAHSQRLSANNDSDEESLNSSSPSMYTYDSSRDGPALLRRIQGRVYNAQNELYLFPADNTEFARLEKNHLIHLVNLGRLYIEGERVWRVLARVEGEQKRILDLGTGVGAWAIGMAQEFPHADVVGIDLAPNTSASLPPNCRFEFDDINLGLPHYYNTFDIVHCRELSNGIKDFGWLITEAAKCLKPGLLSALFINFCTCFIYPGGMVLVAEGDSTLFNEHHDVQEMAFGSGGPGQSWLARAMFESNNAMRQRGSNVEARLLGYEFMLLCPLLSEAGERVRMIPIGPWQRGATPDEDQRRQIMGILMRQSYIELTQSMSTMVIQQGYPPALVQQFRDGTENELNNLSVHLCVKWVYSYATRNNVPCHTVGARP